MSEQQRDLELAAAEFLISNQLNLLRLTGSGNDNGLTTLSIPTVEGITEADLLQILNNKFSSPVSTDFEYIKRPSANGTTIIHISKK